MSPRGLVLVQRGFPIWSFWLNISRNRCIGSSDRYANVPNQNGDEPIMLPDLSEMIRMSNLKDQTSGRVPRRRRSLPLLCGHCPFDRASPRSQHDSRISIHLIRFAQTREITIVRIGDLRDLVARSCLFWRRVRDIERMLRCDISFTGGRRDWHRWGGGISAQGDDWL